MITRRIVVLAAAAACVTACSSTTSGNGQSGRSPSSVPSSAVPTARTSATSNTSAQPSTSTSPGTSSETQGAATSATHPVPSVPLKTATVQGAHDTYTIKVWAQVDSPTCADHAHGQPVIDYLTRHPCHGLTRRLVTTTVGGREVGLATSSLGFAGPDPGVYKIAGGFQTLVTKDGTGNLDDLFRDGYRLPSGPSQVPAPDAFKALGQDAGVVVADAWYLSGPTPDNDPALTTMLEETFLQY